MTIRDEIFDELLSGEDPQAVFAKYGLLDALQKVLAERVLNAELDHHLAEERAQSGPQAPRNHRNGHSRKTVLSGTGKLEIAVPRDRQASFEPQLIAKYRRRFPDFDPIVSLPTNASPAPATSISASTNTSRAPAARPIGPLAPRSRISSALNGPRSPTPPPRPPPCRTTSRTGGRIHQRTAAPARQGLAHQGARAGPQWRTTPAWNRCQATATSPRPGR